MYPVCVLEYMYSMTQSPSPPGTTINATVKWLSPSQNQMLLHAPSFAGAPMPCLLISQGGPGGSIVVLQVPVLSLTLPVNTKFDLLLAGPQGTEVIGNGTVTLPPTEQP